MSAIALKNVAFRYPASPERALDGVDLAVERGEIVLVTGPLGAGCSTLLLLLAGFAPRITSGTRTGTVRVLDTDPGTYDGWRAVVGRIGVLLPTPSTQISGMAFTVRDEVAFGPANLGWEPARIRKEAAAAMERLGVAHLAARDPTTLSGGELQRVILAGLVAMHPSVYLLDEPALELDPEGAALVYELLPTLSEEASVVLATTDVDRAARIAHRAMLLDAGRVVACGTPDAVLGTVRAVALDAAGTVPAVAHAAGCDAPYPLRVPELLARLRP
ncbi:MAG TPA: ABC transporter ATP-binding protein [Gemmatimonadales bacterium]|nr:ABC transporter ATP-binding protein [Gemmatimonadales bacterium]